MPTCDPALKRFSELNIKGLTKDTPLKIDSAFEKQTRVDRDSSSESGLPSVGQYVRKILLTSDNDAQNRLFEFIGREELNKKLKKYGTRNSRIVNRLAIMETKGPDVNALEISSYHEENYFFSEAYDLQKDLSSQRQTMILYMIIMSAILSNLISKYDENEILAHIQAKLLFYGRDKQAVLNPDHNESLIIRRFYGYNIDNAYKS
ncbi:hypothetical protein FQR65_LT15178 [Abscondita terminalis]|nr:hypothetical protein FQR65_LT15178 [Abscondita terminalis]